MSADVDDGWYGVIYDMYEMPLRFTEAWRGKCAEPHYWVPLGGCFEVGVVGHWRFSIRAVSTLGLQITIG